MSDNKDSHSGSRWEPSGARENESPATPPVPPAAATPEVARSEAPAGEPEQGEPQGLAGGAQVFHTAPAPASGQGITGRSSRRRNRGALAGAALALTLVSGTAGFALGHVTAETDGTGQVQNVRNGLPEGDGRLDDQHGDRDGYGDGDGGFPGRGFHEHEHDGDQDAPPGGTNGTNGTDGGSGSGSGTGSSPAGDDGGTA